MTCFTTLGTLPPTSLSSLYLTLRFLCDARLFSQFFFFFGGGGGGPPAVRACHPAISSPYLRLQICILFLLDLTFSSNTKSFTLCEIFTIVSNSCHLGNTSCILFFYILLYPTLTPVHKKLRIRVIQYTRIGVIEYTLLTSNLFSVVGRYKLLFSLLFIYLFIYLFYT